MAFGGAVLCVVPLVAPISLPLLPHIPSPVCGARHRFCGASKLLSFGESLLKKKLCLTMNTKLGICEGS